MPTYISFPGSECPACGESHDPRLQYCEQTCVLGLAPDCSYAVITRVGAASWPHLHVTCVTCGFVTLAGPRSEQRIKEARHHP